MNRAQRIHLEIWKRAYKTGSLELSFPDYNSALSVKMKLYRTIGAFKASDALLQEIAENMVIKLKKDSCSLSIVPRVAEEEEALLSQLGISETDLLSDAEKSLQDSIARIMKG